MGITIAKILKLPVMAQARVPSGAKGIYRMVEGIAMIESPDSIIYLQKNNLVLTNAHVFTDNPSFTETIIDTLNQLGVSGIALKLNRYLTDIPLPMREAADRLDFPIITFPKDITSTQLINSITYEILYSEAFDPKLTMAENFLRELFLNNSNRRQLKNLAMNLGWDLNTKLGVSVVAGRKGSDCESLSKLLVQEGASYVLILKGLLVAVLVLEEEISGEDALENLICNTMKKIPSPLLPSIRIGIGRCYPDLEQANYSYHEARYAVALAATSLPFSPVMHFDHMGIYSVLMDPRNKRQITQLLSQTIDYLRRHDETRQTEYLKTLQVYFQQKQSIEKTAQRLFIHYNSVRYRLQKIHELLEGQITGFSLEQLSILLRISQARDYLKNCAAESGPKQTPGASL